MPLVSTLGSPYCFKYPIYVQLYWIKLIEFLSLFRSDFPVKGHPYTFAMPAIFRWSDFLKSSDGWRFTKATTAGTHYVQVWLKFQFRPNFDFFWNFREVSTSPIPPFCPMLCWRSWPRRQTLSTWQNSSTSTTSWRSWTDSRNCSTPWQTTRTGRRERSLSRRWRTSRLSCPGGWSATLTGIPYHQLWACAVCSSLREAVP